MSFLKYFSFLAISIALFSCSKMPEPTDNLDDPEFYLEGTIDGNDILINAGDEDYYMYTGTEKDATNTTSLYGELSKTTCTNCAPSSNLNLDSKTAQG